MKLEIGQKWASEEFPHEDFMIVDCFGDEFVLSDMDLPNNISYEELPETAKRFFWQRTNKRAFDKFLESKGKKDTSFPYSWYGECKKATLVNKIKKYTMVIVDK